MFILFNIEATTRTNFVLGHRNDTINNTINKNNQHTTISKLVQHSAHFILKTCQNFKKILHLKKFKNYIFKKSKNYKLAALDVSVR